MRSTLITQISRGRCTQSASNRYLKQALRTLLAAALALSATLASAQFGDRKTSALDLSNTPQVLPSELAFPFHVGPVEKGQLAITWTPAPEHYLYRHRFAFTANGIDLAFTLPDGLAMEDEFFGAIEAYFGAVTTQIDLSPAQDLPAIRFVEHSLSRLRRLGLLLSTPNSRHSAPRPDRLSQFELLITNISDIRNKFCENA